MSQKENHLLSGKGFESLSGFKPSKQETKGNVEKISEKISPKENVDKKNSSGTEENSEAAKEGGEDQEMVSRLVTLINQKILKDFNQDAKAANRYLVAMSHGNKDKYYAIVRLVTASRTREVSYEIDRWLSNDCDIPEINEICQRLLKRGYEGSSASWLRSLTPEGMKYGTGTKELRMSKAKEMAVKAGVSLEEIADKYGLKDVLNG